MRCPAGDCAANAVRVAKDWIDIHFLSTGAQRRIRTEPKALAKFAEEALAAGALVVFEASGGCERALMQALDAAGAARRRVNPRQARDFARATGRLAKTDQVDAAVLAEMGAGLNLRPDAAADPIRVRLKRFELILRHFETANAFADANAASRFQNAT